MTIPTQDDLVTSFDDSVISGLGFSVGSVLFGLVVLWLGGSALKKKLREFRF